MKKLVVNFSDKGTAIPDLKVKEWAEYAINQHLTLPGDETTIEVGTMVMINAIRLAVKRGTLDCNNVVFKYNDDMIKISKEGEFDHWPIGFCSHVMNKQFSELLGLGD